LLAAHGNSFSVSAPGDKPQSKNAGEPAPALAVCARMKKPANWRPRLLKVLVALTFL